MGFSPCLLRKRPSHGVGLRLQWDYHPFSPACRRKGRPMDLACACDKLSPLPVEEKAVSWIWLALAIGFSSVSPCLSRKRPSDGLGVRLRWAFPPACRGKGRIMVLVCACDELFPLSVEEKVVSWTWCALAMGFSPACRGKGRLIDLVCTCDRLLPPACRGKGHLMDLVCDPDVNNKS